MKHLPNFLTVLRLLLVIPLVSLFLSGNFLATFTVYIIQEILDQIDGKTAVFFHLETETGKFLDPFVDSIVHLTAFLCLFMNGLLHIWVMVLFIFRELGLMFLRLAGLLVGEPVGSLFIGKFKSLVYAIAIASILWILNLGTDVYNHEIDLLVAAAAGAAVLSGIVYVLKFRGVFRKAFL